MVNLHSTRVYGVLCSLASIYKAGKGAAAASSFLRGREKGEHLLHARMLILDGS